MATAGKQAGDIKIDVDIEGEHLGEFDHNRNPIASYQPRHDLWMLAYRIPTGTACVVLDGIHGCDEAAITDAVNAARQHLHDHQTTAVTPAGS